MMNFFVVEGKFSCEKHPDADKLKVTEVKVNEEETLQIVCGAPNVEAGQKVVVALSGAMMPSGLLIKKIKTTWSRIKWYAMFKTRARFTTRKKREVF